MNKCATIFLTLLALNTLTVSASQGDIKSINTTPKIKVQPEMKQKNMETDLVPLNSTKDAYTRLIAYKNDGYSQKSIVDFNSMLIPDLSELYKAYCIVIEDLDTKDENYDFITITLNASLNELYCEFLNDEVGFCGTVKKEARPIQPLNEEERLIMKAQGQIYDFVFCADYTVYYDITAPDKSTLEERDSALKTFSTEFQNYVDTVSEAKLTNSNIKKILQKKADEIALGLSTDMLKLSCSLNTITGISSGIEINNQYSEY